MRGLAPCLSFFVLMDGEGIGLSSSLLCCRPRMLRQTASTNGEGGEEKDGISSYCSRYSASSSYLRIGLGSDCTDVSSVKARVRDWSQVDTYGLLRFVSGI